MEKDLVIFGFRIIANYNLPDDVICVNGKAFKMLKEDVDGGACVDKMFKELQEAQGCPVEAIKPKEAVDHRVARRSSFIPHLCVFCRHPLEDDQFHFFSHDNVPCCLYEGPDHNPNPLFYMFGQWYYWDESWCHKIGPFTSYEQAKESLVMYCGELEKMGEVFIPKIQTPFSDAIPKIKTPFTDMLREEWEDLNKSGLKSADRVEVPEDKKDYCTKSEGGCGRVCRRGVVGCTNLHLGDSFFPKGLKAICPYCGLMVLANDVNTPKPDTDCKHKKVFTR